MEKVRKVRRFTNGFMQIEAIQFIDDPETVVNISNWFKENGFNEVEISYEKARAELKVYGHKESRVHDVARPTDYIIRTDFGYFFTCTPAIFHRNYEHVGV